MTKIEVIHKKKWFFTSIFKINEYVRLMQEKGFNLDFVDNNVFYWSKK